jgi:hypothetical protein
MIAVDAIAFHLIAMFSVVCPRADGESLATPNNDATTRQTISTAVGAIAFRNTNVRCMAPPFSPLSRTTVVIPRR